MDARLRRLNPDKHWPEILDLQYLTLPGDDPRLPKPGDVWFGAFAGRVLVGFAVVTPLPSGLWYLSRAGVHPDARGQGLQVRMIRARCRAAFKLGASAVITDCTAANPASANSLIRAGFRVYTPEQPWGLPNAIYWRKSP